MTMLRSEEIGTITSYALELVTKGITYFPDGEDSEELESNAEILGGLISEITRADIVVLVSHDKQEKAYSIRRHDEKVGKIGDGPGSTKTTGNVRGDRETPVAPLREKVQREESSTPPR